MLKMGMDARISLGVEKLQALSDSFEDVNYHTENIKLIEAIDLLNKGDKAKAMKALNLFNLKCKITLSNQNFQFKMAKGGEVNEEKMIEKLSKQFEGKDLFEDEIMDEYEVKMFDSREYDEMEKWKNRQSKNNYVVPFDSEDDSYIFILVPKNKMEDGGQAEKVMDLFEDYDNIPTRVKVILEKYTNEFEDGNYKGLAKAKKELENIGYTFDYGLGGGAYDLRKIVEQGAIMAKGGDVYMMGDEEVRITNSSIGLEDKVCIEYKKDGTVRCMSKNTFDSYVKQGKLVPKMAHGGETKKIGDNYRNKFLELENINSLINNIQQQINTDYKNGEVDESTHELEAELKKLKSKKELLFVSNKMAHGGYMAEGGDVDKSFSVATFQSDDSTEEVVEGGLSYDHALSLAKKLWGSGKHYGVEIIDDDPDNMESIVWIKSSYNKKDGGYMADGVMMAKGGVTEKEVVESNAEMVLSKIKEVHHHADELGDIVSKNSDIEAWVIAKIERASTDLSDITHYLDGQHEKMSMGGSISNYVHKMDKK